MLVVESFRITTYLSETDCDSGFQCFLFESKYRAHVTDEIETTSPELYSPICIVSTTLQKILKHIKHLKHIGNWREKTLRFVDTWWLLIHSAEPCSSMLLLIFMLPYTFRIHLFAILLWKKNKSCSIYFFAFYFYTYLYMRSVYEKKM